MPTSIFEGASSRRFFQGRDSTQPSDGAYEVQAVLSGKKKPEAAVKDAQRKADEIMLPYVQSTALTVGTGG